MLVLVVLAGRLCVGHRRSLALNRFTCGRFTWSIAPSGSVSLGDVWIQWGENDPSDMASTSALRTTSTVAPRPTEFTASTYGPNQVTAASNGGSVTGRANATSSVSTATSAPDGTIDTTTSTELRSQISLRCGTATAHGRINETYRWTATVASVAATQHCVFDGTGTGSSCYPTSANRTYQWDSPGLKTIAPYVSTGTSRKIRSGFAWLVTLMSLKYHMQL